MNLRRKRLRLMRDTQWRGYARTAEGNPITLSQIRSVVALSVFGNSSQDGTPSPGYPVDVVGTGERTENLFDISQVGDTNTLYNDGEKLKVTAYANSTGLSVEKFLAMTGLKPGDVFTVARQYEVINGTANTATGSIRFNKKDGSGQFIIISDNKDVAINVVPDDFNNDIYNAINFYGANGGDLKEVIFSNIQILNGSYTADTLPSYEPYGYKVAVTASGRNLFNAVGVANNSEDTDLKIEEYQGRQCLTWIDNETANNQRNMQGEFKEKTQYTFCFNVYSDKTASIFIHYTDGSFTNFSIPCNGAWVTAIKQSTLTKTIDYWSGNFNYATKVAIDIDSSMIVEGAYIADTLPTYEPYKSPQAFNVYTPDVLHGVGDAHDTVILDFDKRESMLITQIDVFSVPLSGYSLYTVSNETACFYQYMLYPGWSGYNPLCTHFKRNSSLADDSEGFASSGTAARVYFRINKQTASTIEEFEKWLNDQNEKGNTVNLCYKSNDNFVVTDITSLQDWDSLPNLKGTWILTATGGTEPTLKAEYYSEERSTE